MVDQRVVNAKGTVLGESLVQEFKASLRGQLIRPGDEGYDEARTIRLNPNIKPAG